MTEPDDPFGGRDELEGEVLEGLELAGRSLADRRFTDCTFEGCTLSEAALRRCTFEECSFVRCDLTMVQLYDTRLREVRFERCKVMGVDFTHAYPLGLEVSFRECVLSFSSFFGMKLAGLGVLDCKARETTFSEADLTEADFSGSDLSGSIFVRADLTRADLSRASGYAIDPRHNRLEATKMSLEGALASARLLGIEVPELTGDG